MEYLDSLRKMKDVSELQGAMQGLMMMAQEQGSVVFKRENWPGNDDAESYLSLQWLNIPRPSAQILLGACVDGFWNPKTQFPMDITL